MRWVLFGLAAAAAVAGALTFARAGGQVQEITAWIEWLIAAVLFGAGAIVDAFERSRKALSEDIAKLAAKPVVVTSAPDSGTHGGYQDGVE
jgi:hypothetical protein